MNLFKVQGYNNRYYDAEVKSLKCPFCGMMEVPNYLYGYNDNTKLIVFMKCTNPECHNVFSTLFSGIGIFNFNKILPAPSPAREIFSDIINEVSPTFDQIYNQALAAEQLGLDQICGVGYRKSLEFLIKDYLISNLESDDDKDKIKEKRLGACIKMDVTSENIKNVAKRATWLGNDETHYVKKWENKEVGDLKGLIKLTIKWIETEIETKKLLDDMPEGLL